MEFIYIKNIDLVSLGRVGRMEQGSVEQGCFVSFRIS